MRRTLPALLLAVVLLVAACSDGDGEGTSADGTSATTGAPVEVDGGGGLDADALSMVVMGDSVAAGEGIAYGYTYDTSGLFHRWTGGVADPTWDQPYPLCHQTQQAYGNVAAEALGADLATFACTGATYENGIVGDRTEGSGEITTVMRPAEFGVWPGGPLNPDYDAAAPDVVVITLGADDLSFVPIVTYCVTGTTEAADAAKVMEEVLADDVLGPFDGQTICTEGDPGQPIEERFWDQLPVLEQHYVALVDAIKARGEQDGKVPQIVFTTYYDPLPQPDESDWCLDVADLERANLDYLGSLIDTLNSTIESTVGDIDGVHVADISKVMAGHEWCTDDPWAYGLSILLLDPTSSAPFHPTPDGQAAIAAVVEDVVRGLAD